MACIKGGTAASRVGMGWYRPEDWMRLLQVISDRDGMHDTFAEWLVDAEKAERDIMVAGGHRVERVMVNPDELAAWCLIRGRAVDGAARAEFVTGKMAGATKR